MTRESRTTIGIKKTTKASLDRNRALGQCYDGFICQLIDLWEQNKARERRVNHLADSTRGNQGAGG